MSMRTWRDFREMTDLRELEDLRDFTSYAIQSQYSASAKILALAAGFQKRIDPHFDSDLFYEKIFNIHSAEGVGLDNWGVILQIGRIIEVEDGSDPYTAGGGAAAPAANGAGSGGVYAGTSVRRSERLNDDYYRLLLLYKAMANISACTAAAQNHLLAMLINTGIAGFPRVAYVLEADKMVIRWVFEDYLDALQTAVFKAAGTLARGAGVGWELYALHPGQVFGFDGSGLHPFNQAPFAPDAALQISPQ